MPNSNPRPQTSFYVGQSYERDNFRKPAADSWLVDHSKMKAALAAAKEEAAALRRAAPGTVSEAEVSKLKATVEKVTAELASALQAKCVHSH